MQKILLIVFLLTIQLDSYSQSLIDNLTNILSHRNSNLPADQVYLHLDRNLYYPGDTIRFGAYIRDRQTGIFDTKSISLYSLLLNSGNTTVDSARFRITNATASGWLKVSDEAPPGDYSILAFTGRMMNYDPEYVFSVPVRINKSQTAQTLSNRTTQKAPSIEMETAQELIDLRFLPEGGTFINGISQRLAFNALTAMGNSMETEGIIMDQNGEKICDFRSGPFGPGLVEFTPKHGNSYFAILNGKEYSGMKWPLPAAENGGVALRIVSSEKGIITVNVEGKNIPGTTYILSLIMNDILVISEEFNPVTEQKFRISTDELPAGTAFITVFNSELRPVAERMVFLNDYKQMNIGISTSASSYSPGEETELIINTTDAEGKNVSSIVSVSVIDSASGFFESFSLSDIKSTFLYDKDFYRNLPAYIRLKGLGNIGRKDADLLFMTYGWRKFKDRDLSDTTIVREIKSYDYIKIKDSAPEKKARKKITLIALEGSGSYLLSTDQNNEAFLPFDSLETSVRQIMILPDQNKLKNGYPVNVAFPENKSFTDKAKQNRTDTYFFPLNSSYKRTSEPVINRTSEPVFGQDSSVMIDPVIIKGNRPPDEKYLNKYQIQYRNTATYTLTNKEFKSAINFENILFRMNPYRIDTKNKIVYLGTRTGRRLSTALFVVDDHPLWAPPDGSGRWLSDYAEIAEMPAYNISSVTMLKGPQGYAIYGEAANGGVIFVTTNGKAMSEGSYELTKPAGPDIKTDLAQPIRIFRSEVEFYIPKVELVKLIPEYQSRPTILWKSEVISDGSGVIRIKYPNNFNKGTVMVMINGASFTNLTGSGSYSYKVK